ncbi:MAG TPA: hypothetical protein VF169_05010 [Albitalea sp.]|uniref:hypothetical protein n=1 Tax=Piscinibacter sp. TaxID=1903157 RepID=UPI002ED0AA34
MNASPPATWIRRLRASSLALLGMLAGGNSSFPQSATNEMWLRGNALETRERVVREMRKARADGVVRRWSPDGAEIPLTPRRRVPVAEGDLAAPAESAASSAESVASLSRPPAPR